MDKWFQPCPTNWTTCCQQIVCVCEIDSTSQWARPQATLICTDTLDSPKKSTKNQVNCNGRSVRLLPLLGIRSIFVQTVHIYEVFGWHHLHTSPDRGICNIYDEFEWQHWTYFLLMWNGDSHGDGGGKMYLFLIKFAGDGYDILTELPIEFF